MLLHVDDVGSAGIIKDTPEYELPSAAWTDGSNVRFVDNAVEKSKGWEQVYGTPSGAPYFLIPVQVQSNYFWFYASLTKIYGVDNTGSHSDISQAATTYSATADLNWNGGVMSGGVVILNNGVDTPQQWTGTSLSDLFVDLANWPASMVARVIRPYKNYLVATDIDEGSGRDSTLLRWSHPADPSGVPSSWDYTDPTYDAGRVPLGERGEAIIDQVELRDTNFIYKESSTWAMQWVGGNNIFAFRRVFDQLGAMSRRCVQPFFGRHFVFATDDVVIHDGQNVEQVFNKRWKNWLFNQIDGDNYERSFVTVNHSKNEVWCCFPESGRTLPNKALVWNWLDNTVYPLDLPTNTAHIAWGVIDELTQETFANISGNFNEEAGVFDEQNFSGAVRDLMIADAGNTKLFRFDKTEQHEGSNFTSFIERDYLPLGRVYKDGQTRTDTSSFKFVRQVLPRIEGTAGGVINIYIGQRNHIDDTIKWDGPHAFTIGVDRKVDVRASGRLISIKFESTTNITWRLTGYTIDYKLGGIR